mmetsp:Transcript_40201/g.66499  ORF Transcript_40201/g.66499 Transcript_40201/m.66499 type:complete len:344 (+) Transcript_40201:157-1188(+)
MFKSAFLSAGTLFAVLATGQDVHMALIRRQPPETADLKDVGEESLWEAAERRLSEAEAAVGHFPRRFHVDDVDLAELLSSPGTLFAVGADDGAIYAQRLKDISSTSQWTKLTAGQGAGKVHAIAVHDGIMYAVFSDGRIRKEWLARLPDRENLAWGELCSRGFVQSIAVDAGHGIMYAVLEDGKLYKQGLSRMTQETRWILASAVEPFSDAIFVVVHGGDIYLVKSDFKLYRQQLIGLSETSGWEQVTQEGVSAIAIEGQSIYGIMRDLHVHSQLFSAMNPKSPWTLVQLSGSSAGSQVCRRLQCHRSLRFPRLVSHQSWRPKLRQPASCGTTCNSTRQFPPG